MTFQQELVVRVEPLVLLDRVALVAAVVRVVVEAQVTHGPRENMTDRVAVKIAVKTAA